MSEEIQKNEEIVVPENVQALFDKADADGEYAAMICLDCVKLTNRDGTIVYTVVLWPDAGKWGKNAMRIISNNLPE